MNFMLCQFTQQNVVIFEADIHYDRETTNNQPLRLTDNIAQRPGILI